MKVAIVSQLDLYNTNYGNRLQAYSLNYLIDYYTRIFWCLESLGLIYTKTEKCHEIIDDVKMFSKEYY